MTADKETQTEGAMPKIDSNDIIYTGMLLIGQATHQEAVVLQTGYDCINEAHPAYITQLQAFIKNKQAKTEKMFANLDATISFERNQCEEHCINKGRLMEQIRNLEDKIESLESANLKLKLQSLVQRPSSAPRIRRPTSGLEQCSYCSAPKHEDCSSDDCPQR